LTDALLLLHLLLPPFSFGGQIHPRRDGFNGVVDRESVRPLVIDVLYCAGNYHDVRLLLGMD